GATTVTSPNGSAAAHRHSMPWAKMPSSLVIRKRMSIGSRGATEHADQLFEIGLERLERLHRERAARHQFQIPTLSMLVHFLASSLDRVLLVIQQVLDQRDELDLTAL